MSLFAIQCAWRLNHRCLVPRRYAEPLISLGYRKPLEIEDLWPLSKEDETERTTASLQAHWDASVAESKKPGGKPPSLVRATFAQRRWTLIAMCCFSATSRTATILQPLALAGLLNWLEDDSAPAWHGFLLALALAVVPFVNVMMQTRTMHLGNTSLGHVASS